jgi:hypothetical protein
VATLTPVGIFLPTLDELFGKRNKFVCSYDFCDRLPHQNSEGGSLYYGVRITRHRREGRCQ